jgi:hypothetical protein
MGILGSLHEFCPAAGAAARCLPEAGIQVQRQAAQHRVLLLARVLKAQMMCRWKSVGSLLMTDPS